MLYGDIIVDINVSSLDKTYQYSIPHELEERVVIGSRVIIPFGNGNRAMKGFIVGLSNKPKISPEKIKNIAGLSDESISANEILLKLAGWMNKRYGGTMNDCIKTVLPVKKKIKEVTKEYITLATDVERVKAFIAELKTKKNTEKRVLLLTLLLDRDCIDTASLKSMYSIEKSTINSLMKQGMVKSEKERIYRNPLESSKDGSESADKQRIILNEDQNNAVSSVLDLYKTGCYECALLHGVTGSGKTEVYMALAEEVIKSGKQVIMLIPEISLTYQTMRRFYRRFGDRVSILNSRMSQGERYDQYERARNHEIDVIIGPRSALFVPFDNLGMIIIDEEHESSYQSEMPPKYHAREVAKELAHLHNSVLLLGSATPSVDTYYRTTNDYKGEDRIHLIELKNRVANAVLPQVEIVDMRAELKEKNYSMISRSLHEKIERCLANKEQIMLFINRRGYAGFVSCRSCGESIKCPHCDVSLTIHKGRGKDKMMCHYCGYETEIVSKCPKCGSPYIGGFGTGTQKVEEMIQKEFPGIRTLRMDSDTTSGKEGHRPILESFNRYEADVLIGTQMIVKGHDFKRVTLVGILAADMSLHISNYQSAEKTYELLVQAAGRAGRGELPGQVVIQTYSPEHYAVVSAKDQDYKEFYKQEIAFRTIMRYPPAAYFMTIMITSESEKLAEDIIKYCGKLAEKLIAGKSDISLIGPTPHPVSKASDIYRFVLNIKGDDMIGLITIRETIYKYVMEKYKNCRFGISVGLD